MFSNPVLILSTNSSRLSPERESFEVAEEGAYASLSLSLSFHRVCRLRGFQVGAFGKRWTTEYGGLFGVIAR